MPLLLVIYVADDYAFAAAAMIFSPFSRLLITLSLLRRLMLRFSFAFAYAAAAFIDDFLIFIFLRPADAAAALDDAADFSTLFFAAFDTPLRHIRLMLLIDFISFLRLRRLLMTIIAAA